MQAAATAAASKVPDWALATLVSVALAALFQLAVPLRGSFGTRVTGDEPFYLLTTVSLIHDGDLDLTNQYELASYREFFDAEVPLWYQSVLTESGKLLSPHNVGLSLLVAPAYGLNGLDGVKSFLALIGGAAMGCSFLLARRITGMRWASLLAAALLGVSAPVFVYASQIYPEMPAALLVAAVGLLNIGRRGGVPRGALTGLLLVALLWLGVKYAPLAACLGALALVQLNGRGRLALAGCAIVLGAQYAWFHLETYGGLTPYAVNLIYAGSSTPELVVRHFAFVDRLYRFVGLWIDREFGLVRWAPIVLLALPGAWLAGRLGRVDRWWLWLPLAVQIVVAVFLSITMRGWWFPGRMLIATIPLLVPLIALTLGQAPRAYLLMATSAILALGTLSVTLGLWLAARAGEVTLAVNPFDADGWWLGGTRATWPLYTAYTGETLALTALWLTIAAGLVWMVMMVERRAASAPIEDSRLEERAALP